MNCHSMTFGQVSNFGDYTRYSFFHKTTSISKLDLMFMKHYAPNRCLYIKVAKLRTGVGNAEMSHLQCQNIQRALPVFYHDYKFSKSKSETGDDKKINRMFFFFFIFHQVIY